MTVAVRARWHEEARAGVERLALLRGLGVRVTVTMGDVTEITRG